MLICETEPSTEGVESVTETHTVGSLATHRQSLHYYSLHSTACRRECGQVKMTREIRRI